MRQGTVRLCRIPFKGARGTVEVGTIDLLNPTSEKTMENINRESSNFRNILNS